MHYDLTTYVGRVAIIQEAVKNPDEASRYVTEWERKNGCVNDGSVARKNFDRLLHLALAQGHDRKARQTDDPKEHKRHCDAVQQLSMRSVDDFKFP